MTGEERFAEARLRVLSLDSRGEGIGRLSEKSQHQILKYYIDPDISHHEVKIKGSYADILNSSGVFEIQTRGTERLVPKLQRLLPDTRVTLVLPLAAEKRVLWVDSETGDISAPNKSPKREGIFDAVRELSKLGELFCHPNLSVKLLYLSVSEYRYLNGWDKSRKRGSTRLERIPDHLLDEVDIHGKSELFSLLADKLPSEFTMEELRHITKRTPRNNFYILRFLITLGYAERVGSRGRAYLYKVKEQ